MPLCCTLMPVSNRRTRIDGVPRSSSTSESLSITDHLPHCQAAADLLASQQDVLRMKPASVDLEDPSPYP